MERLAAAGGAAFEARSGWNVAVAFAGEEPRRLTETVGFADRSYLTKLEIQGSPEAVARIARDVGDGVVLEPGRAVRTPGVWWCPVTPSRMLVLAEPGGSVKVAVAGAADPGTTVVDLTCGLAAMALAGPGCRELLARFCAIDVRPAVTPVTGFRPGSVARTPGYLLREREDQLLLLVGWALGEYLWEVVADAAESLGGGPVGADALAERLESTHA
jgi:heterotetrameric sarcosine oxidase gamma subunit